jgi:hypothetical protein
MNTLLWAHVNLEHDAPAFLSVEVSGVISQEVLSSTPVRRGFL